MGKTETIKERSIYVYLPSIEQKKRWDELAQKQCMSISKFVIAHVENSLRQTDPDYKPMKEVWKEHQQLKEQLEVSAREKHMLEVAFDRLEEELKRYRAQPFLDDQFVGARSYQKELINIIREGRSVSSDEILFRLRVKPHEHEAVKAVSKQLENLEAYGLVVSTSKGWRWMEK